MSVSTSTAKNGLAAHLQAKRIRQVFHPGRFLYFRPIGTPPQSATVVRAMREKITSSKTTRDTAKRQPRFSSTSYASSASSASSASLPTSAPLVTPRITSHQSRITAFTASRITNHHSPITPFLIDIRRLEIAATHSKHTMRAHSNRHSYGPFLEIRQTRAVNRCGSMRFDTPEGRCYLAGL